MIILHVSVFFGRSEGGTEQGRIRQGLFMS